MRKVLELNEKKLNLIPLGVILLFQPNPLYLSYWICGS